MEKKNKKAVKWKELHRPLFERVAEKEKAFLVKSQSQSREKGKGE